MNLSWLKEHLGFTVTIIGAGIGTAIWRGNGLVATLIALVVVLMVSSVIGSRKDSSSSPERESKIVQSGPFSFNYSWQLGAPPNLPDLEKELCARGLKLDQSSASGSKLLFHRGSHFRTRLLGGYFVNPRFLPLRVEIIADRNSSGGWQLHMFAQDTLGIAIRDAAAQKRYGLSASEIEGFVEEGLRADQA